MTVVSAFESLTVSEPELLSLRHEVRDFLEHDRQSHGWRPIVDSWMSGWDEAFSRRLADAGFTGVTVSPEYGGRGLGFLHRYVIGEELIAAGAPVAAHWTADRQVAPSLESYGTEEQKRELLPRIVAGTLYSAIGMSEPEAGSDLAAATTRATRTDGGWLLNGRKVWTTGAHRAQQIVVFARTSPLDTAHRHAGFSQFIVPIDSPGLLVEPIVTIDGLHHFNEVVFTDVEISDSAVFGAIGNGWTQVTSELSFERSGPDRILSTAAVIDATLHAVDATADTALTAGHLAAKFLSLRQLSVSVAGALADGRDQALRAALVKDLGTQFEQDSVDTASDLLEDLPPDQDLTALVTAGRTHRPMFTLRGGTNEILRGMVAKGMTAQ
ncbi:acyl-CoA dehydrogenase family protein [Gordonia hydrophobica]|uniref:acyl-CoA dehydrogenase family protein n=1 Tax=Gordonia hydrophobica TaxID=40516 RepID=UPI000AEF7DEC|nr:acyl-CoA dehydrogenase family protein [Gordonia hydrophobica]MBM7369240.1 acyl-CoA dehydrogenase [Gordonia hydrophobica]